ncbi:MAG: GntR family transcriptional regulator [Clostridia bacterium]|nr:GntR family transcriptional regulator [Clostridia bacterium]
MQFDPIAPIWLQVMARLETEIVTGQAPPGSKLPGGRETALRFGVNPNTVARVYQELERAGLCETRRGLGTYVTADTERIGEARASLAREAAERYIRRLRELGIDRAEAVKWILEEESRDAGKP